MIQEFLESLSIPWIVQIVAGIALTLCIALLIKCILKIRILRDIISKYPVLSLVMIAMVQFCQLEIANHNVFFRNMSLTNIIINIITVFAFLTFLYAVFNRLWISIIIQEIVVTVLGIANYYTLQFRGTPVTAQDIPSIGTAINVSSDLKFTLQIVVTFLGIVAACCIIYALYLKKLENLRQKWYIRIAAGVSSVLILWFFYYCPLSPKPSNTSAWIWRDQYWKYGYIACSFESVQRAVNMIEKPEGYTPKASLQKMADYKEAQGEKEEEQKPDIILILNETFYDFSLIHDFETSEPITPYMDSLKNVIRGYVVVPTIGGGTNRSEYELLTSNSLYLMKDILPFWSLDLKNANSISSVLQEQGYYTMAFHQGIKGNYNRDKKYVEMGFDDSYFREDMDSFELVHGNISDKSGYEYLIEKYENRDPGKPFFAYNLTIQNHISYRPMEKISVEVESGFEGMEEQADTYLSCLRESDNAFAYLTEYFSKVDHPVVICMLGDHGPDYAATVEKKDGLSEAVRKYGERCTPLLIWSNYGLEETDWGTISLPYVIPRLLEVAGVETSPYYNFLCELSQQIPILTAYDSYCDADGNIYAYTEESPYKDKILDYWYFEYYNVKEKEKEDNTFFETEG